MRMFQGVTFRSPINRSQRGGGIALASTFVKPLASFSFLCFALLTVTAIAKILRHERAWVRFPAFFSKYLQKCWGVELQHILLASAIPFGGVASTREVTYTYLSAG
jgi:hypothetical protein